MKTAGNFRFVQISVGGIYTCGVTTTGVTECWGDNVVGQLGDGTLHDRAVPTPVAGGAFVAVFAGQPTDGADHTCALDASGAASCWGANELGQLGATGPNGCGSAPCSTTPVAVTGGVTFTTLALGNSHTCGMVADGHVVCWGNNAQGQLGDGTTTSSTAPVRSLFTP
jgi:alpha-tubulin suppressor-like RCC1 family protein